MKNLFRKYCGINKDPQKSILIEKDLIDGFSHELRNSLSSIKLGINALKTHLPELVDFYLSHQKNEDGIDQNHLNLLLRSLAGIDGELNRSSLYINLLCKSTLASHDKNKTSVKNCLENAIRNISFQEAYHTSPIRGLDKIEGLSIHSNEKALTLAFSALIAHFNKIISQNNNAYISIKMIKENSSTKLIFFLSECHPKGSAVNNRENLELSLCDKILQSLNIRLTSRSSTELETEFFLIFEESYAT